MYRILTVLTVCICPILTFASRAGATDLDSARARWESGATPVVPEMIYLEWERTFLPELTAGEIAQRKRAIADNPEHPDHTMLRDAERRIGSGGDNELFKAWHFDARSWRINIDTPYSPSSTHDDYTRNRSTAWSYARDGAVTVVDAESAPAERNPTLAYPSLLNATKLLLYGGWGYGPSGTTPTDFQSDNSEWRMTAQTTDGSWRYRVQGTFASVASELLITEIELVASPSAPLIGTTIRFENHLFNDHLDRIIPQTAVTISPSGRETQRLTLIQLADADRSQREAILTVPSVGVSDATRGDLPVRVVMDFRPGRSQITNFSEDGTVTQSEGIATSSTSTKSFRGIGWIVAAGLIVTLIVLRVRSGG